MLRVYARDPQLSIRSLSTRHGQRGTSLRTRRTHGRAANELVLGLGLHHHKLLAPERCASLPRSWWRILDLTIRRHGFGARLRVRAQPWARRWPVRRQVARVAYLRRSGSRAGSCPMSHGKPLDAEISGFRAQRGGIDAHGSLWRRWRQACADAGVPLVPLRLASRHSTATDLLRNGAEIEKIRRLLGHTNPKTTEGYACFADQALVSAVKPRGRPLGCRWPKTH